MMINYATDKPWYYSRQEWRPFGGGLGFFTIKVDEDITIVTAREGAFKFEIPIELDGAELVDVEAWVTEVSGGGDVVVSLWNDTQGVDMLSTPATIGAGNRNDQDSFVIDTGNATVAAYDEIWVNVDNAGSGAKGLGFYAKFDPSASSAVILTGAKGDPGGVTDFQGAWGNGTGYTAGDVVTHDGVLYVALQDHTSNTANDEPGAGTNWEDFWAPVLDVPVTASITVHVASVQNGIADSIKASVEMPFDATISGWTLLADTFTDAEIDIWKTDYAGFPSDASDSIVAALPPILSAAVKNTSTTLTGWTTAISAGDVLTFYVSGVTDANQLSFSLQLAK